LDCGTQALNSTPLRDLPIAVDRYFRDDPGHVARHPDHVGLQIGIGRGHHGAAGCIKTSAENEHKQSNANINGRRKVF
jgi:hypothetical protein